ncbi:MAG: PilT/PilU family type 4a pilus ATPase [Actinobacteria bacterium]|nr:MAG: PilT/PilU family type 4a pilus ATPase [Actinomycetota bacterium]
MALVASRRLGEFLVERKVLSRPKLEEVLEREEREGTSLARLLVSEHLVAEKDIVAAVAFQTGLHFIDLAITPVDPLANAILAADVARKFVALPVKRDGDRLLVAMDNPSDRAAVDALAEATGFEIDPGIAERRELRDLGGSDLHLTAGIHPTVRVHGELKPLTEYPVLIGSELRRMLYAILTQKQREKFEAELELDTSHSIPGRGRFRVNVFLQRDSVGAVMRAIPHDIVSLEQLGLPPVVASLAEIPRGLVLVTGPTGSGKSTTLASLVDIINSKSPVHIMTVEDPIEFLHQHKRAVVNQREVGEDTYSFAEALRHVLRQDPDVILVGEMRDLETISTALTAAETGHLVFATLHTQDAPQSVDRVIDVFPAHQQQQIRVQLAASLQAIVTQQLVPTKGGQGRAVASEVLIATPAVRNLIREAKVHQIYSSMQAGGKYGMQTMDQSLADLVKLGRITMEMAVERSSNPEDLRRLVGAS